MEDQIILIDKPAGITSFGVVARVRRVLSEKFGHKIKVGHTGTLDPFATGLLILMSGKRTKDCEKFLKLDKEYIATLCLGKTSTTGDPEGTISDYINNGAGDEAISLGDIARFGAQKMYIPANESKQVFKEHGSKSPKEILSDFPHFDNISRMKNPADLSAIKDFSSGEHVAKMTNAEIYPRSLKTCLDSFVGKISQRVPAFSAVKINGQRAYKLAREGKTFETPTREIEIYSIDLLEYDYPTLKIRCHVSSGTYIRTLAEDIGEKLGTGAYLTALRRTKIGDYSITDAKPLEDFLSE